MSEKQVHFRRVVEERHLAMPAAGKMGGREVVPIQRKLGQPQSQQSLCKTANCHDWAVDVSVGLRSVAAGAHQLSLAAPVGGASFVAIPTGVCVVTGGLGVRDCCRAYKRAVETKDEEGQGRAALGGAENAVLAVGSAASMGARVFSAVQEVGLAGHQTITFGGAAAATQGVLSVLSGILGVFYYLINGIRGCLDLRSWYQGREWREQLAQERDPVEALYRQFRDKTYAIKMTPEEEIALALEAGARWLEKVEEASDGTKTILDKPEAFRKMVMEDPRIIRELIGECALNLTGRGELIRFGKYIAYQNEYAKFEEECRRKLGAKTVEAFNAKDTEALKEALSSRGWVMPALKVCFSAIGFATSIAVLAVSSGVALGALLIVYGVINLAAIFISDAAALKNQLQGGEFKKRDKLFVYLTLALSVVAFVGVVGLAAATGGVAPFVIGLVLSAAWLGVNSYTAYSLWKYDHRRWEVQKEIDLVTYRKFLETNPTPEEIERISQKLRAEDREYAKASVQDLKEQELAAQERHKRAVQDIMRVAGATTRENRSFFDILVHSL